MESPPSKTRHKDDVSINWYPGHMLKAKKEISSVLKHTDIIIEVRDARIPHISENPEFENLLGHKPRLILLNKSDLIPDKHLQQNPIISSEKTKSLFISTFNRKTRDKVLKSLKQLSTPLREKYRKKGIRPPILKVSVVGVPNVGKSSLINLLAHRSATKTGPRPGVTRHQEWVRVNQELELLDTPGVLWPKIDSVEDGLKLAAIGAIKDEVAGRKKVAEFVIEWAVSHMKGTLEKCYSVPEDGTSESILANIAQSRATLRSGQDSVDWNRVCSLVLKDFREGKWGQVFLEEK